MAWRQVVLIAVLSTALATLSISALGSHGSSSTAGPTRAVVPPPPAAAPAVYIAASEHPQSSVDLVVQFNAGVSPAAQQAIVAADGGEVTGGPANGLGVRMPAAAAEMLSGDPRVRAVSLDAGQAP